MSASLSTADIIRQALVDAGEVETGQSEFHARCIPWINEFQNDLLSGSPLFNMDIGQPFPWALAENAKSLILRTPYETGTVLLTAGSASGTFGTAPGVGLGSFADRFLKAASSDDYYKITAHTAGGAGFTLDSAWAGDTIAADTFKAIPLIYDLGSTILRLAEPINIYRFADLTSDNDGKCYGIDVNLLRRKFPLSRLFAGTPENFAVTFQSETKFKVQFSTYVIEQMKVDLDYVPIPTLLEDSHLSIPVIPYDKRNFLRHALAWKISHSKRDFEKAGEHAKAAGTFLAGMLSVRSKVSQAVSKSRGQLKPRQEQVGRARLRGR